MIMDNKIMIVDEQTGRIMDGRRYSDGLHQAIEAKENVKSRLQLKLCNGNFAKLFQNVQQIRGMTGTAVTEAGELWKYINGCGRNSN
jgi:preprotein translocase subunit SecA